MNSIFSSRKLSGCQNSVLMSQVSDKPAPFVVVYSQSEDIRLLLEAFLGLWHFRVAEALCEIELIQIVERQKPSIILFDLSRMYENDLRFLRNLRKMDLFKKIPIMILSGHARPNVSALAMSSGADEYFIKPINFDHLEDSIKSYALDGHKKDGNFGGWL